MKIYFVRHGQSEANAAHIHAGQFDTPLTALGREQATEAGKHIANISFDKIYSSDLSRAKNTAELAIPGCEYETDARLREISVGDPLVGKTSAECTAEFGETYKTATKNLDFTPFGGESREMLYKRVKSFFDELVEKSYENVAVFCHAGAIREVLCGVLKADIRESVVFPNCVIAVFEVDDGKIKLFGWNV